MENQIQKDPIDRLLTRIAAEAMLPEHRFAGFWIRVASRLIDTAVVTGLSYLLWYWSVNFIKKDIGYQSEFVIHSMQVAVPAFAVILWSLIYSPVLEATGGTLGKRLCGIKLVDEKTGKTPYFRNCMSRSILYMIMIVLVVIPAVLSCLALFISDKKQTWHDKLCGVACIVRAKP